MTSSLPPCDGARLTVRRNSHRQERQMRILRPLCVSSYYIGFHFSLSFSSSHSLTWQSEAMTTTSQYTQWRSASDNTVWLLCQSRTSSGRRDHVSLMMYIVKLSTWMFSVVGCCCCCCATPVTWTFLSPDLATDGFESTGRERSCLLLFFTAIASKSYQKGAFIFTVGSATMICDCFSGCFTIWLLWTNEKNFLPGRRDEVSFKSGMNSELIYCSTYST